MSKELIEGIVQLEADRRELLEALKYAYPLALAHAHVRACIFGLPMGRLAPEHRSIMDRIEAAIAKAEGGAQ